jgi:hypothetical protein
MDIAIKIFSIHCSDTCIESIAVEAHLLTKGWIAVRWQGKKSKAQLVEI